MITDSKSQHTADYLQENTQNTCVIPEDLAHLGAVIAVNYLYHEHDDGEGPLVGWTE